MSESLDRYLNAKGTIELFCEIHPNGSRYSDLRDTLRISESAMTTRLKSGVKLDLLVRFLIDTERGTSHAYELTSKGARLRAELEEQGVVDAYQDLKAARKRYDESVNGVREWAVETGDLEDRQEQAEAYAIKAEAEENYEPASDRFATRPEMEEKR